MTEHGKMQLNVGPSSGEQSVESGLWMVGWARSRQGAGTPLGKSIGQH